MSYTAKLNMLSKRYSKLKPIGSIMEIPYIGSEDARAILARIMMPSVSEK